jgi:hypothetical protein
MPAMTKARAVLVGAMAAALATCAGCTLWKEKPANSWSNATGAEHFERLMWRDLKERHWKQFESRLAPGFVAISASGTRDRSATLEFVKALSIADYTLGDFNTTSQGPDMVVTYTARVTGTYKGQPLPTESVRMMTVWQQVTKGWLAIAHSESRTTTSP